MEVENVLPLQSWFLNRNHANLQAAGMIYFLICDFKNRKKNLQRDRKNEMDVQKRDGIEI